MPGKYQHNQDPALAELLHTVTLEGWGNDSVGDVEEDGFVASLLLIEPAEQQELTDAFDQPVPAGNFIVHEDQQGDVTVEQYLTPFHARRAFTALAADTGPGEDDATIIPTGPLGACYAVGLGGRFLGEPATSTRRLRCCARPWTPTRSGPTSGSSATTATPPPRPDQP